LFSNLKISSKIYTLVLVELLLLVACSGYALLQFRNIGKQVDHITNESLPIIENISLITKNQSVQAVHFERAIRFGDILLKNKLKNDDDLDSFNKEVKLFQKYNTDIYREIKAAESLAIGVIKKNHSSLINKEFRKILYALSRIKEEHNEHYQDATTIINHIKSFNQVDLYIMELKVEEKADEIHSELKLLLSQIEGFTRNTANLTKLNKEKAFDVLILIVIFAIVLGFILAILIAKSITRPLEETLLAAKSLAEGGLDNLKLKEGRNEVGQLAIAFNELSESIIHAAYQADNISMGNYQTVIKPRSDKDKLAISLQSMVGTLVDLSEKNNFTINEGIWRSEYGRQVQGDYSLEEFSLKLLFFISKQMNAVIGNYYRISNHKFSHVSSMGTTNSGNKYNEFSLGEGLLGQVVATKKIKIIENLPPNYLKVTSSTGEASPSNLLIVPLIINEQLIGVFEIGSFEVFDSEGIAHLDSLASIIATDAHTAEQKNTNSILLMESQEMAQFLKTQEHALNEHALVSITNPEGRITYANDKFCAVSGYTFEEIEAKDHRIVNSGYHPKEFFKKLWHTIKQGDVWQGEICNKAKDGTLYWVDATIVGYKDITGEISQFVAIRTDITETKVAQSQLIIALNDAKVSGEAKANFLANMSHEIRTPMNGVLGMLALLEKTKLDPEQNEYVDTIKTCGDDLLVIINDILDFSKVEAGKLEMETHPFDIRKTFGDILNILKIKADQKNIQLVTAIDEYVPDIFIGDVTRIRQILTNLVSNAIKFTEHGEVRIEVSSENLNNSVHKIKLSVIDTGIGISKEDQGKLFKSFSQVDASITRKYGGTGLGLAISYSLTDLMNGAMWMESILGEGSSFFVELPLKAAHIENINVSHINDIDLVSTLEVLVVEDNLINQKLLTKTLEKMGHNTDTALNGQEAIEGLDNKVYDIVFMDMQMPVMDGVTATQKIIEQWGDYRPRIVAMTANVLPEDKQKCIDAGMDGFLTKPLNKEKLKEVLEECYMIKTEKAS